MITAGLIAAGGFIGAAARYYFTVLLKEKTISTFPFATLLINLLGAFLLGVVAKAPISTSLYSFMAIGFMGAFTTFSTMMIEAFELKQNKMASRQVFYLFLSCAGGVILAYLGMKVAMCYFY